MSKKNWLKSTGLSLTIVLSVFQASPALATMAFLNVNVIAMTGDRIDIAQTVVVEAGRITVVGPVDATPLPKDIEIVDGTDRYLLPGLADMHARLPDAASPELDRILTLFAANGVTTIRGMRGDPSHLELQAALERGAVFGPRLVTSGPALNSDTIGSLADARSEVQAQFDANYDFLRTDAGLNDDEFDAIAAAAKELGIPFAGRVPAAVGVRHALRLGMATIDHLDGYLAALMPADSDASGGYGGFFDVLLADQVVTDPIKEIAAQTAAAGTWNVPTESMFEHRVGAVSAAEMSSWPEMLYMPRATVRQWVRTKEWQDNERGFDAALAQRAIDIRREIIKALHDADAGLLLGSGAPDVFNVPGFSLHHELRILVEAGLTPYQALATGTTAVAEFLGSNGGVIEVGRDADLLLLDSNPLEDISDIRRVHGVMLRGVWYSTADLKARLDPLRIQND